MWSVPAVRLSWTAPAARCRPFEPYVRRVVEEVIVTMSPEDLRGQTFPHRLMERIRTETREGSEFLFDRVADDTYEIVANVYRLQVHDVITVVHTNGQEELPLTVRQEEALLGNIRGTFEFLIAGPFIMRASIRLRAEETI